MTHQPSVLIVDDDVELAIGLAHFLRESDCNVRVAHDVPSGRQAWLEDAADICLVDIMMPGPSGRVFCRELRDGSDAGVVMMSSLSDSETIIALLEIGADDYIVKPFEFPELLARLRAVLRRLTKTDAQTSLTKLGPWEMQLQERRMIHEDGLAVSLSPSEASVLRFMMASPGTIFSREDLLAVSRTRQHQGVHDRAIDNLFKRLRRKIEDDPTSPKYLLTEWGKGYRLGP